MVKGLRKCLEEKRLCLLKNVLSFDVLDDEVEVGGSGGLYRIWGQ